MNDDDEQDLTDAQRRALLELPAEAPVPAGLEDRVVEALRKRGLVAPPTVRPRASSPRLARLAAAAALFAAGMGAGVFAARVGSSPPPEGSLYLLLLYPGAAYAEGGPADEAARAAEYGAWAGSLRREGRLVEAERLKAGAQVIEGGSGAESSEGPQGFFLVRARDPAQAQAIARACPHLRHGGRVALQAVDPT